MISIIPESRERVKNRWCNLTDWEKDEHRKKLEQWAEENPLAAYMIFTNDTLKRQEIKIREMIL